MQYSLGFLSALVLDLYSAAAEPEHWETFMQHMTRQLGATASSILVRNERQAGAGQHAITIGLDQKFIRAYRDYYSSVNIVYEAALAIAPNDYVGSLQRCVNEHDYRRSEIYNDYARPQDLFHQCCALLAREGDYAAAISFMRPERDGAFGEQHLELLSLLAPHMRQAFQLHNTLRTFEASSLGLSTALDQCETAIFLLDASTRLERANTAGQQLLSEGTALTLQNGFLRPRMAEDAVAFESLLTSACATGAGRDIAPGGVTLLHREHGPALHCRALPFHSHSAFQEVRPAAVLFVGDPARTPVSRAAVMRSLYALTPVESRLADLLLRGTELRDAAHEMGVTFETARYHLKAVFAKTGTSRQLELIRLMESIPAAVQR